MPDPAPTRRTAEEHHMFGLIISIIVIFLLGQSVHCHDLFLLFVGNHLVPLSVMANHRAFGGRDM